jgi:hypothetical protein
MVHIKVVTKYPVFPCRMARVINIVAPSVQQGDTGYLVSTFICTLLPWFFMYSIYSSLTYLLSTHVVVVVNTRERRPHNGLRVPKFDRTHCKEHSHFNME